MQHTRPSTRFLVLFALIYIALDAAYMRVPDQILAQTVYRYGINDVAAALINRWHGSAVVQVQDNRLLAPSIELEIVRGCDGSGVLFLVCGAILAFRASLPHKLIGIAGSIVVIYVLNELRVIGLYYALAERPEWFMPVHVYFIPIALVVWVAVMFAAWINWSTTPRS